MKHIVKTKNGGLKKVDLTPMRAIRIFCLECVGYAAKEVRRCDSDLCPLWPYRLGATPAGRQALREQGELPTTTGSDAPVIAFPAEPTASDREPGRPLPQEPADGAAAQSPRPATEPSAGRPDSPLRTKEDRTDQGSAEADPQPGLFDG